MKTKYIPAEQIAAIKALGADRATLKGTIESARIQLECMETAKDLARRFGLPVNTVRQIMRGRPYGSARRGLPRGMRASTVVHS